MPNIANKIDAKDINLVGLLYNKRFRIDVFQREYKWGKKQMEDLINDVTGSFFKCYDPSDELSDFNDYDCYYMGPVVLCQTNKDISIIDGQQRLTSFSLLLIYLNHLTKSLDLPNDEIRDLRDYIFVRKGGSKTLVLNIERRNEVMQMLVDNEIIDSLLLNLDQYESSNRNIIERYADICDMFPESLKNHKALQIFIDWLLDKVMFVQINAYSMDNAYTIFETMNDRGLNLSPAEILKGYLLSKIIEGNEDNNNKAVIANDFWNDCITSLHKALIYDNCELDFFKAWFRAKYAETKRQSKAGSENEDFEIIGTQFHSWVKNNTTRMGLRLNDDFFYFIKSDLDFFSNIYKKVNELKQNKRSGFESIYDNSFNTIADSLFYPLMLSPISKIDNLATIDEKIKIIGRFVELYSNLRQLQNKSISQSVIRNNIYDLVKEIRNIGIEGLRTILNTELEKQNNSLDLNHLKIYGSIYLKYLLGRIYHKAYSDIGISHPVEYYMPSRRKNAFILCYIQDDAMDGHINNIDFSEIANFVLIPKTEVDDFRSIPTVPGRIEYLINHNHIPEITAPIKGVEDFFATRQQELIRIITALFFYEL